MRQELIDLIRGELPEEEARRIRARAESDAELRREIAELQALLSLVRRGETVEPSERMARAVLAAAERECAPSLRERLATLAGLVRFRFRNSMAFRVAAVSLGAHLLLMGVLFVTLGETAPRDDREPPVLVMAHEVEAPPPRPTFVARLRLRHLPHEPRLREFGVEGQGAAIDAGIGRLLEAQAPDGSFGDVEATARAALVLLAEGAARPGHPSADALRGAMRVLLQRGAEEGGGATLAALSEDYALGHGRRPEAESLRYAEVIRALVARAAEGEAWREGRLLAVLAGFGPARGDVAEALRLLADGNGEARAALREEAATRLRATLVLARGHRIGDRRQVRTWVRPLFREAIDALRSGGDLSTALLTLQAPYRL